MVDQDILSGPPTMGELDRLAQSYTDEANHEASLANSLRAQGHEEAERRNRIRARRHRRTAEILRAYAREIEIRAARPAGELAVAE